MKLFVFSGRRCLMIKTEGRTIKAQLCLFQFCTALRKIQQRVIKSMWQQLLKIVCYSEQWNDGKRIKRVRWLFTVSHLHVCLSGQGGGNALNDGEMNFFFATNKVTGKLVFQSFGAEAGAEVFYCFVRSRSWSFLSPFVGAAARAIAIEKLLAPKPCFLQNLVHSPLQGLFTKDAILKTGCLTP